MKTTSTLHALFTSAAASLSIGGRKPRRTGKRLMIAGSAAALLLTMGCNTTSGLNRSEGVEGYAKMVHALPKIAHQPASGTVDQSIAFPLRLAVVQLGEMAVPETALAPLRKRTDLFQSVISLPMQSLHGDAVKALNSTVELALASGANHIFIIGGQVEHKVTGNGLDILDYLIVPQLIVPTQDVETNIRVGGTLVRCADRQILRSVNVDDKKVTIARKPWVKDAQYEQAESMRDDVSQNLAVALITDLQTRR